MRLVLTEKIKLFNLLTFINFNDYQNFTTKPTFISWWMSMSRQRLLLLIRTIPWNRNSIIGLYNFGQWVCISIQQAWSYRLTGFNNWQLNSCGGTNNVDPGCGGRREGHVTWHRYNRGYIHDKSVTFISQSQSSNWNLQQLYLHSDLDQDIHAMMYKMFLDVKPQISSLINLTLILPFCKLETLFLNTGNKRFIIPSLLLLPVTTQLTVSKSLYHWIEPQSEIF